MAGAAGARLLLRVVGAGARGAVVGAALQARGVLVVLLYKWGAGLAREACSSCFSIKGEHALRAKRAHPK